MADWIAVVDDDILNLRTAGTILSKNKIGVSAFKSAKLLLDFMKEGNRPDLILLDIIMPECNGFDALTQVRELEKELGIEETPIIFLTAKDDKESVMKVVGLKPEKYLLKSMPKEKLTNAIDEFFIIRSRKK